MPVRVGINGFGRMGRALYRASLERDLGIEVVAINELGSLPTMAGLLARDSVYAGWAGRSRLARRRSSWTGARSPM
jgi:glyceraldehyde-3-phosphate dehydrogenase/erythrose-4-phosphate dehydrogenase